MSLLAPAGLNPNLVKIPGLQSGYRGPGYDDSNEASPAIPAMSTEFSPTRNVHLDQDGMLDLRAALRTNPMSAMSMINTAQSSNGVNTSGNYYGQSPSTDNQSDTREGGSVSVSPGLYGINGNTGNVSSPLSYGQSPTDNHSISYSTPADPLPDEFQKTVDNMRFQQFSEFSAQFQNADDNLANMNHHMTNFERSTSPARRILSSGMNNVMSMTNTVGNVVTNQASSAANGILKNIRRSGASHSPVNSDDRGGNGVDTARNSSPFSPADSIGSVGSAARRRSMDLFDRVVNQYKKKVGDGKGGGGSRN